MSSQVWTSASLTNRLRSVCESSACKELLLKCFQSFCRQASCNGAASFECRVAQCNTDKTIYVKQTAAVPRHYHAVPQDTNCWAQTPAAKLIYQRLSRYHMLLASRRKRLSCNVIRIDVGTRMTHDWEKILRLLHVTGGPGPSRFGATLGRALVDPPPHHGAEP